MSDPNEFTPKELFQISLYKEPNALVSKSVTRSLSYLLPSVGLVAYSLVSDDKAYGLVGYGILLFQSVYRLSIIKRAVTTLSNIIRKYEARIQIGRSGS